MNNIDLNGRTAIVTGGAQGIGLAIAARLQQSGATLVLWDYDQKLLEHTESKLAKLGAVMTCVVNIADAEAVSAATEDAASAHSNLDILVNSAGIAGPTLPVQDCPVAGWREVLDVNLTGTFLTSKYVLPHMLRNDYGRILNIASIAGKEGNANAAAYSASKAGVIALTKSMAKENADKDIAINCITPAAARTRIFDQMPDEHINFMLSKIPRGRFVEVDEIASMVAWIVSAENSFTTGAAFDLSGGRATY